MDTCVVIIQPLAVALRQITSNTAKYKTRFCFIFVSRHFRARSRRSGSNGGWSMSRWENRLEAEPPVDDTASASHLVTERDLLLFATVSGDVTPVHLDEEFAAATPFGGRIAHGMLSGALISAAIACELP